MSKDMKRLVPSLSVVVALLSAGLGSAVHGAIPPCFTVETPQADATGVPTDTRIVFSVTETDVNPNPQLVVVGSEKEIPLELEAAQHSGPRWWSRLWPFGAPGRVHTSGRYTFKPREKLQPRTRYEIRCWRAHFCGKGSCPVVFTTGEARQDGSSPTPGPAK